MTGASAKAVARESGLGKRGGSCRFCGIAERERVIYRDQYNVVLPSAGSLIAGWLLVVPTDHVLSLMDLPPERRAQFVEVVDRATSQVESRFGPVVQFEHGPGSSGTGAGCGVDHAHLHVVPARVNLRALAQGVDPVTDNLVWRAARWPWVKSQAPEHDYLFVRDIGGDGWFAEVAVAPSQLFRRALARHLGESHWDWKQQGTRDESLRTLAALTGEALRPLAVSGTDS